MGLSKGIANVSIIGFFIVSIFQLNLDELKQNIIKYKHVVFLGLIFKLFLFGLIHTDNIDIGWKLVRKNHRFILVPILILMNVDLVKKYFKNVLFAYLISVSIIGLLTILLYFSTENFVIWLSELTPFMQKYILHYDRVSFGFYSPFYDRLQFSNMLGISTLVGIYLFINNYNKKWIIPCVAILIYTSILLGGRAGQIALLISIFTVSLKLIIDYYKSTINKKKVVIISSLILTVFIVSPFLLYKFNHSVNKRYSQMKWELETFYSDNNTHDITHFTTVRRLVSWENTWKIAHNNFIFGVGTGDYDDELQKAYDTDNYNLPTNSHSQYLYFWASFGIIGLSIFLFVIGNWLKNLQASDNTFLLALGFIAFYGVTFLSSIPLSKQIDNMTFTILFSSIGVLNLKSRVDKN